MTVFLICLIAGFLPCSVRAQEAASVMMDRLQLEDGSVLLGTIQSRDDEAIVLLTDYAGRLTIDAKKVRQVTAVPQSSAATQKDVEPPATPDMVAPDPQPEALEPAAHWSARVELGLNGKSGNSNRSAFRGRADAKRTTNFERLFLYTEGNYAKNEEVRSANELFGGARWERDLTDRWFLFAKTEMEQDEFEMLDFRATGTAGVGYFFLREEDHELKGRVGPGYLHESFSDGRESDELILDTGYDYRLDLLDWFRFTHSLSYFPVLEDPGSDYRLLAETGGEIPLGPGIWKLRAGVRNEYDSMPQTGVERLDTSYFINLVAEWK